MRRCKGISNTDRHAIVVRLRQCGWKTGWVATSETTDFISVPCNVVCSMWIVWIVRILVGRLCYRLVDGRRDFPIRHSLR